MSKINDGGPAFPVICENGLGHVSSGMTLRDYFAGQALSKTMDCGDGFPDPVGAAIWAYKFADALLAHREKDGDGR